MHAALVPAVEAMFRKGKPEAFVEIDLIGDETIIFFALRAGQDFLGQGFCIVGWIFWQSFMHDRALPARCGNIVAPAEALRERRFFFERHVFVRDGFVVCKRRKSGRKEFAPFAECFHVLGEFREEDFIFLFCIFHIKNTM